MRIVLALVVLAAAGCFPKRDLPADQIGKLTKLAEIMDVQATIADPQFKKIGQASYTDADFTSFADVGARIQATSLRIKEFSKGPGFDELAVQLNTQAKALADAAQAKDAAAASKAMSEMKATCKTCHQKFR
jgi:cytochrome c556